MKDSVIKNQRGNIFLITLIIVFLMTLVGMYAYQMSTRDLHYAQRLEKAAQAHQLAEAGLARALSTITAAPSDQFETVINASDNFPLTELDPGTYDASVSAIS